MDKLKAVYKALFKEEGAALVVTLLVMLVLILLGLALVLQSNTEHLIAQNEEDSSHALSGAEAVVFWANRIIRDYVTTVRPLDLDAVLNGTFHSPAGAANIIGFRTYDSTKGRMDLGTGAGTTVNEQTVSGREVINGENWEIFRVPPFTGNVRTVVRTRILDNYDPTGPIDTDDTDLRIRLEVIAEYPVFVDNDGREITNTSVRPRAYRHLMARFGPAGSYAIRTDGDLDLHGSLKICGECGSVHANSDLSIGADNVKVCGEATGTGTATLDGSATVVGDKGISPEVYIPIINPYSDEFVPGPTIFDTHLDGSLIAALRCNGPSTSDPGNAKYFALIRNSSGGNQAAQVYKAYRDFTNNRWVWRLIDEVKTGDNDFTAVLDDCGRVVSCDSSLGCFPDQIYNGSTWNAATNGVSDGGNGEFYGFDPNGPYNTTTCTGDTTITGVAGNNWNKNDFPVVTSVVYAGSAATINTSSYSLSPLCSPGPCSAVWALPGVGIALGDDSPSRADFKYDEVLTGGSVNWRTQGNTVYSPLYNAVLFVYGDVSLGGNLDNIVYFGGTESLATNLNDKWRLTVISTGHLDVAGTVRYGPAGVNFQYSFVSGRDLQLAGNDNTFQCSTTDCDGSPVGTTPAYAGSFVAHEQIRNNGNVGVNGFMIAEEHATCDNFVTGNSVFGSTSIYYDCNNPVDPWKAAAVRMRDWEEVQRQSP